MAKTPKRGHVGLVPDTTMTLEERVTRLEAQVERLVAREELPPQGLGFQPSQPLMPGPHPLRRHEE